MSSIRNAVQRRNHKERSQPQERSKWGLLEKHKDYSLRAKDYNEKKAKLKVLREKARARNPDEFSFSMMSHRFQDGGKRAKKSEFGGMPHATSQLLKTQDAGYLRTMIQSTRRARERLAEELTLQRTQGDLQGNEKGATKGEARRHVVFVDDRAEQKTYQPLWSKARGSKRLLEDVGQQDDVEVMDDKELLLDLDEDLVQGRERSTEDLAQSDRRQKIIALQERKLEALRLREQALVATEQELELQRARMNNSIGGVTRAGHKFKIKERKK